MAKWCCPLAATCAVLVDVVLMPGLRWCAPGSTGGRRAQVDREERVEILRGIMEILEAFDLTGSFRAAGGWRVVIAPSSVTSRCVTGRVSGAVDAGGQAS